MGKHSAAPASPGEPEWPRQTSTAGARHSAGAASRGESDAHAEMPDEPIDLLAEPLSEPLHEPLSAFAEHLIEAPAQASVQAPVQAPVQPVERLAEQLPPATRTAHRSHVSRHAHSRVDERPEPTGQGRRMTAYALAALLTAGCWAVLVYLAIQLGPDVKRGETQAWVLMGVATVGAMGCLFLALVLGGRVLQALRNPPTRAAPALPDAPLPGGRRAKR